MIRHTHGDELLLITQHDHALLSGRLAEHLGGLIAKPSSETIQGIALHDCGWPLHDDEPTLDEQGLPLHVFHTRPKIATRVWTSSARRAANKDVYTGLLVSLHVLNLSVLAQAAHARSLSPHDQFELHKFQHQQVELQESLRKRLGLRIDLPLTYGLARPGASPREEALLFDYHLLRAMDQLSLVLCCSEDLFPSLDGVYPRPGARPIQVALDRPDQFTARLDPWPFHEPYLRFEVPCRRIPNRRFADEEEFRRVYADAPAVKIPVCISSR